MKALSVKLKAFPLVLTGSILVFGEGISLDDTGCSFSRLLDAEPVVEIPKHLS